MTMTTQDKMIRVKQDLSDKYRTLASVAKSIVKQRHFMQKAKRYQGQVSKLSS